MRLELLMEDLVSKALRPITGKFTQTRRVSQGFFQKLATELSKEGLAIRHVQRKADIQLSVHDDTKLFLIGGSDEAFGEDDYALLEGRSAFVQNLTGRMTEQLRPLPIGVEDFSYARNGMPWNFRKSFLTGDKTEKVLVGPFRPTSPTRSELLEIASASENCRVVYGRIPAVSYARLSASYRYVACPEGNGIDTHRFWEALYRGSLPIVRDSQFIRNWQEIGVPMVVVSEWHEIVDVAFFDSKPTSQTQLHWTLDPRVWKRELIESLSMV